MIAIDIENLIVHTRHENPSYREFFKKDMPRAEEMKQFGEMGVLKTTKKIRGKLENRGIPVMYLGRARDHAADTHRFLNLKMKVEQSNDLNDIKFEFTARDNPQPNGKIEKRFDIIFN